jgi:ABC-type uncharacterized transport system substrate-binding protein
MKNLIITLSFLILGSITTIHNAVSDDAVKKEELVGKKVLYISSYDTSYEWSRGIEESIDKTLEGTGVITKRFHMDTKHRSSEAEKQQAATHAKQIIDEWNPDVVITSDDDAAKYVIAQYYKDDPKIPFVFCGVNWDPSIYGFPYKNVTGMIEVDLIDDLARNLRDYSNNRGRLGFLALDGATERREASSYQKRPVNLVKSYFVKTYDEFKNAFIAAQDEVDILVIANVNGIQNFDFEMAKNFVKEHVRIPIGVTVHRNLMNLALMGLVKKPSEQGTWAANAAINILKGTAPSQIPMTTNKDGELLINGEMASRLKITFKPSVIKHGKEINQKQTMKP